MISGVGAAMVFIRPKSISALNGIPVFYKTIDYRVRLFYQSANLTTGNKPNGDNKLSTVQSFSYLRKIFLSMTIEQVLKDLRARNAGFGGGYLWTTIARSKEIPRRKKRIFASSRIFLETAPKNRLKSHSEKHPLQKKIWTDALWQSPPKQLDDLEKCFNEIFMKAGDYQRRKELDREYLATLKSVEELEFKKKC